MDIVRGEVLPYRVRIDASNARRSWSEREGMLLKLTTTDGLVGWGEAAPLPGYSIDDGPRCAEELSGIERRLPTFDPDAGIWPLLATMTAQSGVSAPAATFALESALVDLVSRARAMPAWRLLRSDERVPTPIPISALVDGETPEDLAASAEAAAERGIPVVKVKVGAGSKERDEERLAAVRRKLPAIGLRLDANQALPVAELGARLASLAAFGPELLEEPVPASEWSSLVGSPVPFAMDESLATAGWKARLREHAARGTCRAVVLKPMALGGFVRCRSIAEEAERMGLSALVTHLFDGAVASSGAATLALALAGAVRPCGLDTFARPFAAGSPFVSTNAIIPVETLGLGIDGDELMARAFALQHPG